MARFIRMAVILLVVSLALIAVAHTGGLRAKASPAVSATLFVNTGNDGNSRDSSLTLREAILIARGDLTSCLTDAEMGQIFDATWNVSTNCNDITGGVGQFDSDGIYFAGGVTVVTPTSELPALYCSDEIASSLFSTNRIVTITGVSAGSANGLVLQCPTANASISVKYLTIRNFSQYGLKGYGIQASTFKGLQINNNSSGGIYLSYDSTNSHNPRSNTIGTANAYDRNYIFSNGNDGLYIEGNSGYDTGVMNNLIYNNYIGVNISGTVDQGNSRHGIELNNAWYNVIGGSAGQGNLISGNNSDGIKLNGADATGNGLYNNIIGLNASATAKIGNTDSGISIINGAHDNLIGLGSTSGNIIAGNDWGIFIGNFGSNSNSVAYNTIGTNSSGASGLGNSTTGVGLYDNVAFNDIGTNGGNTISGNGYGVEIGDSGTNFNTIKNNKIGTNSAGTARLANTTGVYLRSGPKYNEIGFNTISGNSSYGVWVDGSGTLSNTVYNNKIGTNITGTANLSNTTYGVYVANGASYNSIGTAAYGNLISGNGTGLVIDGVATSHTLVYKNYIGTNAAGTAAIPNGFGVVIQNGSDNNLIGDTGLGNLISGNTYDGLRLKDSGTGLNNVYSNTIGLNASANAKLANGWSGIAIFNGASGNHIGTTTGKGNIISGNGAGVYISDPGTQVNLVISNVIGTNWSSASGLGNTSQGVGIYSGAALNFIGFATGPGEGNIISGNGGPGVDIGHSGANANTIEANFIGTNRAGTAALPNGIGVRIWDGASNNFIGTFLTPNARNLISGNSSPGVGVYDANTMSNTIAGNYIGTNRTGTAAVANGNEGVIVQAAASTVISSNLISGNHQAGINIDGAHDTRVENNIIGTNSSGTAALANHGSGVSVINSALRTTIGSTTTLVGRNLISGNAGDGVYLNTVLTTTVESNLIGLNLLGTSAVPNAGNGIAVEFSNYTYLALYGGYQYISGNTQDGVYVVNSDSTQMSYANRIGYALDDTSPIGNGWDGVMLNGATHSTVGGRIGNNGDSGVGSIGAANNNRIEPSLDKSNGGLPIDLGEDGPTTNDLNDVDTGPNGLLNYPEVVTYTGSTLTGTVCANCTVLIYQAFGNPAANGGGAQFTGQVATANGSGVWTRTLTGGLLPISVTLQTCAGACSNYSNTSEFSPVSIQIKVYLPLVLKSY